jgi:hypothetical protein
MPPQSLTDWRLQGLCSIFLLFLCVDRSVNEIHKTRVLFSGKVIYKIFTVFLLSNDADSAKQSLNTNN